MKWRGQNRAAELGERSTILKNTILVVDDEELERSAIQEALLDDGHKVITSGSGSHARELLASPEESIKLVLLDWIMPDVDGIEILKWIRREPDLESVEVIMLSARVEPEGCQEGGGGRRLPLFDQALPGDRITGPGASGSPQLPDEGIAGQGDRQKREGFPLAGKSHFFPAHRRRGRVSGGGSSRCLCGRQQCGSNGAVRQCD